jgi:two-component sensor histidine kinase/CheY-like chemotaxis protein
MKAEVSAMTLSGYKAHVLLIDDDQNFLNSAADHLEGTRYKVAKTGDGNEGIAGFEGEKPDIVVAGSNVKNADGVPVVRQLRKIAPDLPIVAVSGSLSEALSAVKEGAWDYLVKPVAELEALSLTIDRCMERSRLLEENRRYRENIEGEITKRTSSLENALRERIRSEELLTISLTEKNVLLREVHHRVKNNLQVISSLLSLQESYTKNEAALSLLKASGNRIKAMALVHESVFRADSMSSIDFTEYVQTLFSRIVSSYNAKDVVLKLQKEAVEMPVSSAIPCGLILNELISNSICHGFKNKTGGIVEIEIVRKDPEVSMTVRDNGPGLPPGFDVGNSQTLGFQLITNLAAQIMGSFDQLAGPGAAFMIRFPAFE